MVTKKSIFVVGVLVIAGTTFFYLCTKIFTPAHLIIRADKRYDAGKIEQIKQFYSLDFFKKKKWKAFCKHLHHHLPLQSAHMHLYPTGSLVITLKAPKPVARLHLPKGKEGILTQQARIESHESFHHSFCQQLPHMTIQDEMYDIHTLAQDLISFFNALQASIFADYTIYWINKTEIILAHRTKPFKVLVHARTQFTPSFMKKIAYCSDLIEQKKSSKKQSWLIDARFKNQCILRLEKEG